MQINYQKAKTLCTDVEFEILTKVKPQELAKMMVGELRALVPKARKYSDKWLAQSRSQGNSTDGAGARSFAKHEFFKEALSRIEAKLAKVTMGVVASGKAEKQTVSAKKTVTTQKVAGKKIPAKKVVAKKAVKTAAAKKIAKKIAKKAVSTRARNAMSLANQAKQKSIGIDLRMAKSGLTSRVRGHVSAQGRRNQAARSARKR